MIEKLRQLKKKSQMTNQQIAEKSNIPESTVARIFSGKTPNPTITTVVSMARAMGGSVNDFLSDENVKTAESEPAAEEPDNCRESSGDSSDSCDKYHASSDFGGRSAAQTLQMIEYAASHEKFYEDMINMYKTEINKKDAWLKRLFWILTCIILFILAVLVFDITHPSYGFVKY